MRRLLAILLLSATAPLAAQIATPDRPVTDPKSLNSPKDPAAKPVPIDDLGISRSFIGSAWSADGKSFFTSNNLTGRFNVWRSDVAGSWPLQLTQSDDRQFGLTPSPDGKTLYFRQDVGGDEQYDIYAVPTGGGTVVNLTNTPDLRESSLLISRGGGAIAMSTKRKADGQTNIAVLDVATGKVRALTAEPVQSWRWSPVAWVDNDRAMIVNRDNADGSVAEVWRIDVASGKATQLLAKADTVYDASDATADGKSIAVTTNEGTGQLHAMVYDSVTKKLRGLKPTPWEQTSASISPDGSTMLTGTGINGRQDLAVVNLATFEERPLPLPPGINYPTGSQPFSPDGSRVMVEHSGADTPTDLFSIDVNTGKTVKLTNFAMASLTPEHLPKSTIVTYKSFDGTLVSGVVTMPFNLKRDGTSPAIVFPHGGPTGQTVDGFSDWATALASRGYVVIQPNPRGSTGYGIKFQKGNYQDLGGGDLKDELAAKDFLVASGYVDAKRVGIAGGSYGGFMTLMAIGRAPDAFAAAVDLFGIIDWRTMWTTSDPLLQAYLKSLLDTPEAAPKAYDASSPLTYINAVKAPLLVIQGENDIRVPPDQSRQVIKLLKARGSVVEGVFYPAEGHGFYKRENNADSLKRMVAWFDKYLKPMPAK